MRSSDSIPVSLSSSYFFLLPLLISMTAANSSVEMRSGLMSCQIFIVSFASPLFMKQGPTRPAPSIIRVRGASCKGIAGILSNF